MRILAATLGRSAHSIRHKLDSLDIDRARARTAVTVAALADRVGVDRKLVKRVGRALGQKWIHRRVSGHGNRFQIEEEDAHEIVSAIEASWSRWSRHHDACRACGTRAKTRARRHRARGLCEGCYVGATRRPEEEPAMKET